MNGRLSSESDWYCPRRVQNGKRNGREEIWREKKKRGKGKRERKESQSIEGKERGSKRILEEAVFHQVNKGPRTFVGTWEFLRRNCFQEEVLSTKWHRHQIRQEAQSSPWVLQLGDSWYSWQGNTSGLLGEEIRFYWFAEFTEGQNAATVKRENLFAVHIFEGLKKEEGKEG